MQLFCLVHGGKVAKNPKGKEVGLWEVRPTAAGRSDPIIGRVGRYKTLQWHGDIVEELPSGAISLASSKATKNQTAVLDGIHYMFQSDGQAATPVIIKSWLKRDAEWATKGTGVKATELIREAADKEAYLRNTFFRIFGNFLALALQSRR
jgi:GMP synthase-like glutamine amidotransferase